MVESGSKSVSPSTISNLGHSFQFGFLLADIEKRSQARHTVSGHPHFNAVRFGRCPSVQAEAFSQGRAGCVLYLQKLTFLPWARILSASELVLVLRRFPLGFNGWVNSLPPGLAISQVPAEDYAYTALLEADPSTRSARILYALHGLSVGKMFPPGTAHRSWTKNQNNKPDHGKDSLVQPLQHFLRSVNSSHIIMCTS